MFKRVILSHERMWEAVVKAPLILVAFVAPFLAGILISPTFAEFMQVPEWLGVVWFTVIIAGLVYFNGLLGSFFFGLSLFYFLNAIRMQNRWIYYLSGFAAGSFFNIFDKQYTSIMDQVKEVSTIGKLPVADIAIASYPIIFGLLGMTVAWNFWRILAKGGEVADGH